MLNGTAGPTTFPVAVLAGARDVSTFDLRMAVWRVPRKQKHNPA